MRDILLTAFIFGSLPFILKRPWLGILMWAWVSYMNPHKLTWGFAYSMPFAQAIAIVTLIAILMSPDKRPLPKNGLVGLWMLFIVWMFISAFAGFNPKEAMAQLDTVWKIQLITALTVVMMQSRYMLIAILAVSTLSIAFYGIKGGVFVITTGGNYSVWGPDGTMFGGNNELGLALLMTLPILNFFRMHTDEKPIQDFLSKLRLKLSPKLLSRLFLLFMLLCLASVVATYSRGAMLAGLAMLGFLWLKSRQKGLMAGVAVAVIVAVLVAMPSQWFDRMNTIETFEEDSSAMQRINSWTVAWRLALDNPIFGGGFKGPRGPGIWELYAPNPEWRFDAHSIYFQVLGEQGFVGLAMFLLIAWLAWRYNARIAHQTRDRPDLLWAHDLAKMLQVSMVAFFAGGAFLGMAYFDFYWHIISFVLILRILVEKELAKPAEAPEAVAASTRQSQPG